MGVCVWGEGDCVFVRGIACLLCNHLNSLGVGLGVAEVGGVALDGLADLLGGAVLNEHRLAAPLDRRRRALMTGTRT